MLLLRAKSLLETVTPTAGNCGRFCGARCCRGDGDMGMELLPGEYEACALGDFGMQTNGIFVCRGTCDRKRRPYACMIYPLFPLVTQTPEGPIVRPVVDIRAEGQCPLTVRGIDRSFYTAVRRSALWLLRDDETRTFLLDRSEKQREAARLKQLLGF